MGGTERSKKKPGKGAERRRPRQDGGGKGGEGERERARAGPGEEKGRQQARGVEGGRQAEGYELAVDGDFQRQPVRPEWRAVASSSPGDARLPPAQASSLYLRLLHFVFGVSSACKSASSVESMRYAAGEWWPERFFLRFFLGCSWSSARHRSHIRMNWACSAVSA